MPKEIISKSPEETMDLGRSLGRGMTKGAVLGLVGGLGAGKTEFVKGLAEGLGVMHIIQSPTFILMNLYPAQHESIRHLVHVDCYRVRDSQDLIAIGIEDYLTDPSAVVAIEWADKIRKLLPDGAIMITLDVIGEGERRITIS